MDINEKVLEIVLENSEKEIDVTPTTDLEKELGIDSFGYLMIINSLEDEFKIRINETEFQNLRTVSQIVTELISKYPEIRNN